MLEQLQPVQKQDLKALASLYAVFEESGTDLVKMEQAWDRIQTQDGHHLLGYYRDGVLLASIVAVVCPDLVGACRPFMAVENVVVSEQCRGQGIGKLLMGAMDELARQEDCGLIMLVSSGFRKEAHRFYEQCGYSEDVRGFRKRL